MVREYVPGQSKDRALVEAWVIASLEGTYMAKFIQKGYVHLTTPGIAEARTINRAGSGIGHGKALRGRLLI